MSNAKQGTQKVKDVSAKKVTLIKTLIQSSSLCMLIMLFLDLIKFHHVTVEIKIKVYVYGYLVNRGSCHAYVVYGQVKDNKNLQLKFQCLEITRPRKAC